MTSASASTFEALMIDAMPYYSGRYLQVICPSCRRSHPALRDIPEKELELHHNDQAAFLHCQLCGVEITGPGGEPQSRFERIK